MPETHKYRDEHGNIVTVEKYDTENTNRPHFDVSGELKTEDEPSPPSATPDKKQKADIDEVKREIDDLKNDLDEPDNEQIFTRSFKDREWIPGGGGGSVGSAEAFGYEIDGTDVIITDGAVCDGKNDYSPGSDTTLGMAAGTNEVYVDYDFVNNTVTVSTGGSLPANYPADDRHYYRHLYTFDRTDDTVTLTKRYWWGEIPLPGTVGIR